MPEPLKNIYSLSFFESFIKAMQTVKPDFDQAAFLKLVYDNLWEERELKERMRHLSWCMHELLPWDYETAMEIILKLTDYLLAQDNKQALEYMFLPDYIEVYGLKNLEFSLRAFEKITPLSSCEFAVRPFLKLYPNRVMQQMLVWTQHPNHHVRRFASEGCRPLLPWAMQIKALKDDPLPIIPILKKLKNDPSDYVRRSVANNLNDVSKNQPALVLDIVKNWKGKNENTDRLLKHGSRTLLKKGQPDILKLFGFLPATFIEVDDFIIETARVSVGNYLKFRFDLAHKGVADALLRLEYALYFMMANGKHNRKVFKISEKNFLKESRTPIQKRHSFKPISTRRYYEGQHQLALIINGIEGKKQTFYLDNSKP